jgi:hypothetical protein
MSEKQTCYMCDSTAISSEHVPPKCIFPESKDVAGKNFREICGEICGVRRLN